MIVLHVICVSYYYRNTICRFQTYKCSMYVFFFILLITPLRIYRKIAFVSKYWSWEIFNFNGHRRIMYHHSRPIVTFFITFSYKIISLTIPYIIAVFIHLQRCVCVFFSFSLSLQKSDIAGVQRSDPSCSVALPSSFIFYVCSLL